MFFVLAITEDYFEMAESMINSIRHYHSDSEILIYTVRNSYDNVKEFANKHQIKDVVIYQTRGYNYQDWHPIIWAKIELFNLECDEVVIFLDVDQIMYNPINKYIKIFENSNKKIGASSDDEVFGEQFLPLYRPSNVSYSQKAMNSGAFMLKPDKVVYEELKTIANKYSQIAKLPTQLIFNIWISQNENLWLDLGSNFMCQPFSPKVLESPKKCCLIHFWTPRPPFFKLCKPRKGERTYEELCDDFEINNGQKYPEEQLKKDYFNRLNNIW